ncbi:MAG: malonyl-[acyl-carrier protein] O-methyltransferase BioC [Gammaproteobacteria bacterium RIFOXYA12_FULL_61_12]|nr:MAG: malonyl-[acyl-carrier protein] O-methyltransferase BioC [Gammaproteobacteria bacterium RIFOXYA12_FULL_61_12]OGT90558.1 MAG: malonyl-[acyl-carrier protein] O-methyltransferase BioC [Gammaproteobacteria bacterium RIFOXYD12_FULL_61_37]
MNGTDKRRARRAFDQAAASYDKVARLQLEMGERLLGRLDYIRIEPRTILDIGAGTGMMAERLARRYPKAKVLAADFAHGMLLRARRRGPLFRKPRCLCADAERLPLTNGCVDLIISNAMLQWCDDPARVFSEWLPVLRPGGLLMFTSFGPDTLKELRSAWAAVDGLPHVSRFFDMHELGDALLGIGWEGAVMDIDRFTLTYADAGQLMRDIKSLGASNAATGRHPGLTGKDRMRAMIESYEPFRQDGLLPASYEVIYGHAWAPAQRRIGNVAQIPLTGLADRQRHGG